MRKTLTRALSISLWSLCAAHAQNSDLGLLGGISGPRGQTTVNGAMITTAGSVTPSVQVNFAWQVLQRAVDLYVELPLVVPIRVVGTVAVSRDGESVAGSSGPDLFFTPGVRLKISPESRVSFYGAAGFGIASFGGTSTIVIPATVVAGGRKNSPAFGFGGGVDIRITRLLSLRGDVRDFITETSLGGIVGRNHGILQFGIAFHF